MPEERPDLERARAEAMESSLRMQIQHLLEINRRDREKLEKLYASRSWRVARMAVRVLRALKRPAELARNVRARKRPLLPQPGGPAAPMPINVARFAITEDAEIREAYERALAKRVYANDGRTRIAVAVHTLDLSLGRGDVYVAVGLGRYLERIGYDVVYLPRNDWFSLPDGTDVYLALLDEVDLVHVPATCKRIAWIRNRTVEWLAAPSLQLYDGVLCSSEHSLAEIRRSYAGPTGLLRIGVDHELFNGTDEGSRTGVSTTVNQWGTERQLFRSLLSCRLDFPLAIYGEQRGLNQALAPYWHGKLSFFALPSLYAQSRLVLDDHNHSTQPFGNVNSRVFEALACGAALVTNSSLGLHEIGLGDVPTYASPAELDAVVHEIVEDPEGIRPLTKSLQKRVLDDHTFEKRAQQFDAFVKEIDEPSTTDRIVVGFFPDYRQANPYQAMLYGWGRRPEIAALPVPHPRSVVNTAMVRSARAFVYHLHWTAPILGPAKTEDEARGRMREFLGSIDALKAAGGRFAWTIHNVIPHECAFPAIEAELGQGLADRADLIHVMCDATEALVGAHYRLPADRVRVVEHPSYIGVYPNVIDQASARTQLGLDEHDVVLIFFGGIRPYKGLEELLDAFEQAAAAEPALRLIVAGPAARFGEVESLRERCASDPRIVSNFNRVADGDVQVFMNAADVAVLPHRAVLNSGSLLLALSFGRPVIAPVTGCVRELLTPDVSLTFDAGSVPSMRDALMRARELRGADRQRAAFDKAMGYDVTTISARFAVALSEVTG